MMCLQFTSCSTFFISILRYTPTCNLFITYGFLSISIKNYLLIIIFLSSLIKSCKSTHHDVDFATYSFNPLKLNNRIKSSIYSNSRFQYQFQKG